eukprot:2161523-Rhodomonas_salina.1
MVATLNGGAVNFAEGWSALSKTVGFASGGDVVVVTGSGFQAGSQAYACRFASTDITLAAVGL